MMFDRYITVDWSASNQAKTGADSIWLCALGRDGDAASANPPTRGIAAEMLFDLLLQGVRNNERILVGFDFPYAFPSGSAAALGLGLPAWQSMWEFLEARIVDNPQTNQSNRFMVGSEINRILDRHAFWGHPVGQSFDFLLSTKRGRIGGLELGLAEFRETELQARSPAGRPKSVWQLYGNGSVGSQALTGIPVVARLRHHPDISRISRVWPFELTAPISPRASPPSCMPRCGPALSTSSPSMAM